MILINFNGSKIPAENDGTTINPPQYWIDEPGQSTLNGIAAAFANGEWEPVPEPTPRPLSLIGLALFWSLLTRLQGNTS